MQALEILLYDMFEKSQSNCYKAVIRLLLIVLFFHPSQLDAEEPQVQFSTVDDTLVAKCISAGWYHMPKVTWRNRKEEDLSGYSKTEILEEKRDGSHRVVSTLHYPVLLHEIYTCHIEESDVLNRPVRSIHKVPS